MPKNLRRSSSSAFTLIEVLIVIVIIAIIAAFTIPNYTKMVTKADERNVIANLLSLRGTIKIYTSDGATIGTWATLTEINTGLGSHLIDTKSTYFCRSLAGQINRCEATHPSGWAIGFRDETVGGRLHCVTGGCPSCPTAPGNCG
ncbi:MAG: prepilin-type N-terminal cleavage/methylation domain-containing protein [Candidatus Omnitrophica bacterium]|nr:prepilin-type N-terminal cleavage/methylation domain-containing protein [Candidatus Omnitrophota bacterium]